MAVAGERLRRAAHSLFRAGRLCARAEEEGRAGLERSRSEHGSESRGRDGGKRSARRLVDGSREGQDARRRALASGSSHRADDFSRSLSSCARASARATARAAERTSRFEPQRARPERSLSFSRARPLQLAVKEAVSPLSDRKLVRMLCIDAVTKLHSERVRSPQARLRGLGHTERAQRCHAGKAVRRHGE